MQNHYNQLKKLHTLKASPLVLKNCWDIHSAKEIEHQNGTVIATSSYAVADHAGYTDGEHFPFEHALNFARQLVASCHLPITYDIEGFYAEDVSQLYKNAILLLKTGISGINFEDQKIQSNTPQLWSIKEQVQRIKTIKHAAKSLKTDLFINARTDLFLHNTEHTSDLVKEALIRTEHYQQAGADCIFIPGLANPTLIKEFCRNANLPVNIMLNDAAPSIVDWDSLDVSRISYGPHLYLKWKQLQNGKTQ